jgi:restriction system protein
VIERLGISEAAQGETLKNGESRVRNQVAWARFYLAKAGLIDASQRGVWSLTEKGLRSRLVDGKAYDLFREVRQEFHEEWEAKASETAPSPTESSADPAEASDAMDHRGHLLQVLRGLPPDGFERICQRLLRESGFEQVTVTGRSGDGGIDGVGILEVNPFVSFKVLFQCKRYTGSVSASQVRDFRGAMMGRADKGLILTTGTFTLDAKREARRDGVPPIELVDGEKLIDMFERLELGLRPRTVYDVDDSFFKDYR